MTSQEAKEVLLLYRPDTDRDDPDFTPALEQLRNDAELKRWFEQHCAMQKAVFDSFEHISVPEGLKEQILSERRAHTSLGALRSARVLVAAAVAVLLLIGITIFYTRPPKRIEFSTYQLRMAGITIRYPKMDLYTADLGEMRRYLAEHGGQKDYVLPARLEKMKGTGCKIFDWRGKRVSMLCFNSGKNAKPKDPDLFLFIVDRSAVQGPATQGSPEIAAVRSLTTASWVSGNKTYFLAASGDQKFLKEHL